MQWKNGKQEDYTYEELEKVKAHYFDAGKKVRERSWNSNSKEGGIEYTIENIDGEMTVQKESNLPVSDFEGAELIVWTHERCPENSPAGASTWSNAANKITVKNGKFIRIAQRSDSYESCDCPLGECEGISGEATATRAASSPYTPTTWDPVPETEWSTDKGISFHSNSIGSGWVSPSSPDTVRVSNNGRLRPRKDGKIKQLVCFSECIDGSKLAQAAPGLDVDVLFEDVGPPTRRTAHFYTFNEQTGVLVDSNGNVISKAYDESASRYGYSMTLVEASTATYTELGCSDSDTSECQDTHAASMTYTWSTGSEYSTVTYLKDAAGTVRIPVRQIELKIVIPAGYDLRTLSGASYAGKTILADYENGRISGLPVVCQNEKTMTYREADYTYHGGKAFGNCNWDNGEREVSDFLLPRGVKAVSENIFAGTKTEYVLKPTLVRQKLKSVSSGACGGIDGPPTGTTLPDITSFGDMRMPARPTTAELKVEGGMIMVV